MLKTSLISSYAIIVVMVAVLFPGNIKADVAGHVANKFADTTLELPEVEGSHGVGNDQNNLGIHAYKKNKFNQALKHFKLASMVDKKKGEIFFNLGLTLHKLGNHLEAAKHLQWALKLSPTNEIISGSKLLQAHHCDNNPKIPCGLKKPEKHKMEGSDTISPQNYMSSTVGGY
ncbi:MAG: tetratricopeptide repeat protein [Nitrospinota bacterium]|nr:tetratricopeptide repeat protein [Nitrospinota bacterium]